MTNLEKISQKLEENYELTDKIYNDFIEEYGEDCDIEENNLDWKAARSYDYTTILLGILSRLNNSIVHFGSENPKVVHTAKRDFKAIITDARSRKKDIEEDIQKAQQAIDELNEIISICKEYTD